jgi:hypothetical protein
MIFKIALGIIALFGLVYMLSRIQMKAWMHEFENRLHNYLPDKDDNSKS